MRTQQPDRNEPQKSCVLHENMRVCFCTADTHVTCIVYAQRTHNKHCIKYFGDNDSDGKAILQNILLFIWPAICSAEETKEVEEERRQRKTREREIKRDRESLNAW